MLRDTLLKENKDLPKAFANHTLNAELTTASSYRPLAPRQANFLTSFVPGVQRRAPVSQLHGPATSGSGFEFRYCHQQH